MSAVDTPSNPLAVIGSAFAQTAPLRVHTMSELEPTDEKLAQRMFGGDEEATRALVGRYRRPLYGMLMKFCRDPEAAADLFQETFLRAIVNQRQFDRSRRLKPWLFTIALNLARDRARRLAHPATPRTSSDGTLPEPAHDRSRGARRRDELLDAMSKLNESHREVLLLRYFEGMEESEIAAATAIPRGTVKSRLHHAMRNLRKVWNDEGTPS